MANFIRSIATATALISFAGCSSDSQGPSVSAAGGTFGAGGGSVGATGGVPSGGTAGSSAGGALPGGGGGASGGLGAGGVIANGGAGGQTGTVEPRVPTTTDPCPTFPLGGHGTITVQGQTVEIWAGNKQDNVKGAVFFYWHGTGGHSSEATSGLGSAISEITAAGGLVASFEGSTRAGAALVSPTPPYDVWYEGDYKMADAIYACATKVLNIDTHQIYTGGCSAGGLASGAMAYLRSSYIASAMPNSGGIVAPYHLEEPKHVPSVITTHGALGTDVVQIEFTTTSIDECTDLANRGGFEVDCDHGGGHCQAPPEVTAAQWTFLKAHPFGVSPEPYATALPASFPSYCKVIKSNGETYPPPRDQCVSTTACTGGQTCCYQQGPHGSNFIGESSSCVPGACPTGQVKLCATNAECTSGQQCIGVAGGYCG